MQKKIQKQIRLFESITRRVELQEQKMTQEERQQRLKRYQKKMFLQALAGTVTGASIGYGVPELTWKYSARKQIAAAKSKGLEPTTKLATSIGRTADQAAGRAAGVVIFVALASAIALGVYGRFMSKEARACKQLSGKEKTICMYEVHIKALDVKANDLRKAMNGCKFTTDPEKCKQKLQKKIEKILDEKVYMEQTMKSLKAQWAMDLRK